MRDIAERLREYNAQDEDHNAYPPVGLIPEAADEIERLRERLSSKERHCADAEAEVWKLRGQVAALCAVIRNVHGKLLDGRIDAALSGAVQPDAVRLYPGELACGGVCYCGGIAHTWSAETCPPRAAHRLTDVESRERWLRERGYPPTIPVAVTHEKEATYGGCKRRLAPGQWWGFCGETDMGQTAPALCTECGGEWKLADSATDVRVAPTQTCGDDGQKGR